MTDRDQGRGDGRDPIDEEAAWAEIVAGYGPEPADPPGVWPPAEELDLTDTVDRSRSADTPESGDADEGDERDVPPETGGRPEGDTLTKGGTEHDPQASNGSAQDFLAGTGRYGPGQGPRDWEAAEGEDEDHFVPPEPPPLPETDLSTKMAWVAVIGGPLLLIGTVLLQRPVTWWIATLGIGGFLGGFAALVARMRDGDDDWTDPGSGAVV